LIADARCSASDGSYRCGKYRIFWIGLIQVAHSFGAVSRLDDDRDLDERGDGHQAGISGLDGFDEGTPFGFASQDGNERDVSLTI
jgi:hypothetical protein